MMPENTSSNDNVPISLWDGDGVGLPEVLPNAAAAAAPAVIQLLGASPLDPSRDLSRCALWSSFTFSRLDHCQCRARAADWALQADTRVTTPCSQSAAA